MPCITLLTDFGTSDEYVGLMKGVILSIHPTAALVDLCHEIPPQDVGAAARMIESSYRYFPAGSVHVIVVDPGVGSDRAIVAAFGDGHFFIAPDNGCLELLHSQEILEKIHRVENPDFFLKSVSRTFHGRDIFAPAAAHLATGIRLEDLGPPLPPEDLHHTALSFPELNNDGVLIGAVTGIDRFGNLLTNISEKNLADAQMLKKADSLQIRIGLHSDLHILHGLCDAYAAVDMGKPLAIIGSRGYVEIAVRCGRADRYFGVDMNALPDVMVSLKM